jgi:hypothetical protein
MAVGHDSTIAPLTGALGVADERWPPFASNVTIEVLDVADPQPSDTTSQVVRVKYNHVVRPVAYCAADPTRHFREDKTLVSPSPQYVVVMVEKSLCTVLS